MNKKEILAKKNVVGVGKGCKHIKGQDTGREAIVVFVTKKVKTKKAIQALGEENIIPKTIDGIETDVIETGEFYAHRTTKHRPMPSGVSGGHYKVTAGTLNGFYWKNEIIIITNNHVGANCNDALIGDPIWQPGKVDGGTPDDVIGYLEGFVPIKFSGASVCPVANFVVNGLNWFSERFHSNTRIPCPVSVGVNKVDLSWARVAPACKVLTNILDIGEPNSYCCLTVGESVTKSGRTTGVTTGTVTAVECLISVNFGGQQATFDDQILTTCISQPGDSGSLVLNNHNQIGGLLFAGSNTSTIVNTIENVLIALG